MVKNKTNQAIESITKVMNIDGAKINFDGRSATDMEIVLPKGKDGKILYPTETDRGTVDAALGKSYLVKNDSGNLMPNYDVILETFNEIDNSIDLEQFADSRTVARNSKAIFQTDSIVNSKNFETNSSGETRNKFTTKTVRNVEVINNLELGTATTEINTRDQNKIVAFNLAASDMEQHNRMRLLSKNRFLLKLMIASATNISTGATFDKDATDLDAEYINLGKKIYPQIKNAITQAQEIMTIYRPGGFVKNDIFVLVSPTVHRACVDYQSSLPSSDKAFVLAADGELYNSSIDAVRLYKTNLLKAGQLLTVNGVVEYDNNENIEVLIGFNKYTKYVKATPLVLSQPLIVGQMTIPYLLGQRTESMHNGVVIVKDLFITLDVTRAPALVKTAEITNISPTNDGATFDVEATGDVDVDIVVTGLTLDTSTVTSGTIETITATGGTVATGYTINVYEAGTLTPVLATDSFTTLSSSKDTKQLEKSLTLKDNKIAKLQKELKELKNAKKEDKTAEATDSINVINTGEDTPDKPTQD